MGYVVNVIDWSGDVEAAVHGCSLMSSSHRKKKDYLTGGWGIIRENVEDTYGK
jgi:hypothetical protein